MVAKDQQKAEEASFLVRSMQYGHHLSQHLFLEQRTGSTSGSRVCQDTESFVVVEA